MIMMMDGVFLWLCFADEMAGWKVLCFGEKKMTKEKWNKK
jgi:hypothetical protein